MSQKSSGDNLVWMMILGGGLLFIFMNPASINWLVNNHPDHVRTEEQKRLLEEQKRELEIEYRGYKDGVKDSR